MSKLNRLIANCRNTEMNGVANRIIIKFDEGDWSSDTHLTEVFNLLKAEKNKLTTAINREKAESDLEDKDEVRDEKLRGIYFLLKGYLHYPDDVIRSASENVDKVFERYGLEIISDSYVTESSLIASMLEDFAATDVKSEIDKLPGLTPLITELGAAQTDFETARVKYEDEQSHEKSMDNATKIKRVVGEILNEQLIIYLRAMVQVDKDKYSAFADTVGLIIDDTNTQIKKRRKKPTAEPETV